MPGRAFLGAPSSHSSGNRLFAFNPDTPDSGICDFLRIH